MGCPSHPGRGLARVGWRQGTPKWREIWGGSSGTNSADPGDWEINHVFKKTGSFLVHFPFSFGEQREGLLLGGAGGRHELEGAPPLAMGLTQFPEAEGSFPVCSPFPAQMPKPQGPGRASGPSRQSLKKSPKL